MATFARNSAPRRAVLVVACSLLALLVLAPCAMAGEPAPDPPSGTTAAPDPPATESTPKPDPAPAPPPPSNSGGGSGGSSGSSGSPAPAVIVPVVEPSGPTAEEIAAELERKQAQAAREKAAREAAAREQALAEAQAREQAALAAGVEGRPSPSLPELADEEEVVVPPAEEPAVVASIEPASQPVAAPVAATGEGPSSSVASAAPVLLGLLALAMILLGLAAIPPWTIRSSPLAGLLAQRRVEIGLIGTAILASAAIGLAIAVAAK